MVSMYRALVLSSICASKSSGRSPSTNLHPMPRRGNATLNWLYVPPYRNEVETMLSPASQMVAIVRNWADWPDEVARAATPPSSAAIRFSNTSQVGFMMRE